MANLRLLAVAIGLLNLASVTGCAPLHAPQLAGRVIDAATGAPVAGVEIFTHRQIYQRFPWVAATTSVGDRWTTADADGRFVFEPETIERWFRYYRFRVNPEPYVLFLHRKYGAFLLPLPADRSQWNALVFELTPSPGTLRLFENRRNWASLCSGWRGPACLRMCLLAYDDPKYCEEAIH